MPPTLMKVSRIAPRTIHAVPCPSSSAHKFGPSDPPWKYVEAFAGSDNFCLYGASYPDCPMTAPGGYCDPDGNGDFGDADWVRGWNEHKKQCG